MLFTLRARNSIVVDHHNVCSLVDNKTEFKKTKVGMLQYLCQSLETRSACAGSEEESHISSPSGRTFGDSCPCQVTE